MKAAAKIFGILFWAVAALISCEPEIKVTSITIEVSKASIADDGVDATTFKVRTNTGEDVTSQAIIINIDENTVVRGGKFSSDVSGIYVFSASYNGMKSDEVGVRVGSGFADGDGETEWVITNVKTPVRYAEGRHYGSSTATAIDVTRAESGPNGAVLQFTCIPGEEVKSYRVQVYPLAWVYNQLLELMKGEGKEELTVADANDALRELITNQNYEVIAGQVMNKQTLGSSWYSTDFDWLNTSFEKGWSIQADADYLIVTLSSFEETCSIEDSYASLAVCHFSTAKVTPDGNPSVGITYDAGFSSYSVTYTPNTDCKYLYYFSHSTSDIDEYIGVYGTKMFRDYIRHNADPVAADEPLTITTTASDILKMENTAVVIALDRYGIPVDDMERVDFSLLTKPADRELGSAFIGDFVAGSAIAKFKVEMDKNTFAVYQGIYTREEAEVYMNADLGTQENLIYLLRTQGWGHENHNFKFDRTGVLDESAPDVDDQAFWNELAPDTEYAILYVALNGYGDLSRLAMSEPFRTKPQVRALSQTAVYDPTFKFKLESLGVNGLRCSFNFDPEVVAQVFFGMYDPARDFEGIKEGFTYPNASSNRDTWMYWLLDYREPDYGYPWADNWGTADTRGGTMDASIYDLEPGTHYKYMCVYETWDGYISDIIPAEVTLQNISWGPAPKITMTVEESTDQYMGDVYLFEMLGNADVGEIMYIGAAGGDENSISLALSTLLDNPDKYTEDQYCDLARSCIISLGINAPGNLTNRKVAKSELEGADIYVVAAIGKGKSGDDFVWSDVEYYVWTKEIGKFQTLAEYLK